MVPGVCRYSNPHSSARKKGAAPQVNNHKRRSGSDKLSPDRRFFHATENRRQTINIQNAKKEGIFSMENIYFRELALNLRQDGFTVKSETEDGLLPVELDGHRLAAPSREVTV